jgi:hypothetical protein
MKWEKKPLAQLADFCLGKMLVEGPTEDRFVKAVLRPHLEQRGVTPIPTIITTKRVKDGPDFKGGVSSFGKIDGHLRRLLVDTDAVRITAMLDFYEFHKNFAGWW